MTLLKRTKIKENLIRFLLVLLFNIILFGYEPNTVLFELIYLKSIIFRFVDLMRLCKIFIWNAINFIIKNVDWNETMYFTR